MMTLFKNCFIWLCNALEAQLADVARVRGRLVESVLVGVGGSMARCEQGNL